MAEQSNQVKSIFLEAIEHAPEQWPAFLDRVCAGDVGLRAEVEKLLRSQAAIGSFRETTRLVLPTAFEERIGEHPGAIIGPYKLLEQIGEGGFGVVFLAEQQEPIRRKVALKVLKPGMDTRQFLARFEAERQALGLMDHPHIARVLDAGATEAGRPWFVMELVYGVPITEFCDRNRLSPEARLALFLDVCHAIQHAHHKGIIHRDIKPGNVLVTLHDGKPTVKVIDFGVAKALAEKLTERTLFTASGQMIGTPVYMSPEQVERGGLDIDTRSDVYALGVLLYELLTGTTPLESQRLREAGYAEMQRLIREEEALPPSRQLSSLGDSATVLAGNRGLDAKRLARLLAGDLDWIVLKALEKDRNRRYGTPASFAEDIDRYLRREPILARPPSTAYRVTKFVQRNRAAVLTAAVVVAALLAGIAVATWQAVSAWRAEVAALGAAEAERRAKEEAEAREAESRAVLKFVENKVFSAARPVGRPGGQGPKVTLRKAVEGSLPYVATSFPDQPLIEARLRQTLGMSFEYLGDAKTAAEQFEAARDLYARHRGPDHPSTLRSMNNLAISYGDLGRYADALRLHEQTLALLKTKLGPDHPDTLVSMNNLANSYAAVGRRADALRLREQTLALRQEKLGPDHPDTLASMHNLAISYGDLDRYADALRLHEQTLALMKAKLGPDHPDTLASMEKLATAFADLGRHGDALPLSRETLALRKEKLGPEHPDTLASMHNLATGYADLGRHADAVPLYQETLALRKVNLGTDHPGTLSTMNNLAVSYTALGRYADALRLHEETLALMKAKLGPDHPDTLLNMANLAQSLVNVDRGPEAMAVLDDCMRRAAGRVVDPRLIPAVLNLRLRYFQTTRDVAGCRQTAELWEKLKRTDASSLYDAACMRAVTAAVLRATDSSSEGCRQADAEADRAMTWLERAVAAGYNDATHLKQDKDLDALRGRADFSRLVTALQARVSEKKP
jgi:serine/threonine protein kinase/tetratricopeptide (TPR) repeat protein